MHTEMNVVHNADMSHRRNFREQHKVLQVESNNTDIHDVYNADMSRHNRDFGDHLLQMLASNAYSDTNDVYANLISYYRDIEEHRRERQEANTHSDITNYVYAHLCRHRDLEEQRRKLAKPSDLLNKALAAIHTIVDCVALVAEEEDNANSNMNMNMNMDMIMNMDMNTASTTTTTNDNRPSNNQNPMYHNFQPSSAPLLLSSSIGFQQHLQQLQHQQQMKHELHHLQQRQQELVQMMGTNMTTMSMPISQNQQEQDQQQQQQLESTPATAATATITPAITQKTTVNLGRTNFTSDLTEETEEPTRTVDNTTTEPSKWDILIGRGKGVDNHTGNIYYRKVVESFRKQYENMSKKGDKTKFIRDVVAIIYENGHQFVKKVKNPHPRTGCTTTTTTTTTRTSWVPVDRDVARDKVSNSFRNAKRLQTASASASASASTNYK